MLPKRNSENFNYSVQKYKHKVPMVIKFPTLSTLNSVISIRCVQFWLGPYGFCRKMDNRCSIGPFYLRSRWWLKVLGWHNEITENAEFLGVLNCFTVLGLPIYFMNLKTFSISKYKTEILVWKWTDWWIIRILLTQWLGQSIHLAGLIF